MSEMTYLNVSIGRYYEGYTTMEIDVLNRKTSFSRFGGSLEKKVHEQIVSQASLDECLEQLQQTKFLTWENNYINTDYYEGTKWSVEYIIDHKRVKKYGENKFPLQWDLFCEVVENLVKPIS